MRPARVLVIAASSTLCATAAARADQPTPAPPAPARPRADTNQLPQFERGMEFEPRNPNDKVSLALEDADLQELVRVIGELTGRRFLIGTSKVKTFKATIVAAQKVTVAEAYQAFLALLQTNGLTVVPSGRFLKIVESQDVQRQTTPVTGPRDALPPEERFVTRIHRLSHVSADDVVSRVLSKLASRDASLVPYGNVIIMTDTGTNLRRMLRVLEDLDVGGDKDQLYVQPLKSLGAADAEKLLQSMFDVAKGAGAAAAAPAGEAGRITRIVALERPNALAIVATREGYERVFRALEIIDTPQATQTQFRVVKLQHGDAKRIVPALNELLAAGQKQGPAQLEAPVKVSAEESTNAILVTASARDFAQVKELIAQLDQPRRQVYIEAAVLDLSMSRTSGLGVALHGAGAATSPLGSQDGAVLGGSNPLISASPLSLLKSDPDALQALALSFQGPSVPLPPAFQSLGIGASIPSFGVLLTWVATATDADIVSTPHILATDNTPAEIRVQINTALQNNVPAVTTAANGFSPSFSVPRQSLGPRIKVTPHLNESDEVRLDVEETISDVTGEKPKGTLATVDFLERVATTTLTVRDQQTVVIGGLVRDKVVHSETKVPVLGDIPVLGALFRSSADRTEKSNLVLVLTPHIIRSQDDLRAVFERKMHEQQQLRDHSALFSPHQYEPPRDWSRTTGLLDEVRRAHREVVDRRAFEATLERKPVEAPARVAPIDLPGVAAPASAAAPSEPAPRRNPQRVEP